MKLNKDLNKILRHGYTADARYRASLIREQHESAPVVALGLMIGALVACLAVVVSLVR